VVMDGIGDRSDTFGNAVAYAQTPVMNELKTLGLSTTLAAHGTAVGLPSDSDIGNSEVGHNALGAGRIFDQGAKLVQQAIASGSMFRDRCWADLAQYIKINHSTLHLMGLLSDGNVHSHEQHLHALIRQAKKDGIKKVRIHVLFDGRDVSEKSAEIYVDRLERVMAECRAQNFDVSVASGGGRMTITMDRYEADWSMVERGWRTHVLGEGRAFSDLPSAVKAFRAETQTGDQYLPAFVIHEHGKPVGTIQDGDGVVFFNFRGDRAIEISRAFTESDFKVFDRIRCPKVFFAGMMEYDGDKKIPAKYLVSPPLIKDTLGEYLVQKGKRQFACSETQKFGHVTYFWNGNRSGYLDQSLEEYLEIPSDVVPFDQRPWMKAEEITRATIERMQKQSFDFARINYANGDMVGHTGDFEAAVIAVATVDLMLGRLLTAAKATNTILVVTADHGNADEMFDAKAADFPNWEHLLRHKRPKPKTAHTLSPVPFFVFDPVGANTYQLTNESQKTLSNVANTVLTLMGVPVRSDYLPSLVRRV